MWSHGHRLVCDMCDNSRLQKKSTCRSVVKIQLFLFLKKKQFPILGEKLIRTQFDWLALIFFFISGWPTKTNHKKDAYISTQQSPDSVPQNAPCNVQYNPNHPGASKGIDGGMPCVYTPIHPLYRIRYLGSRWAMKETMSWESKGTPPA